MKPTRLLIGLAALIAALSVIPLGYQAVTGQPIGANTILQTDAPSGVAPAFRANGQDANISINLVPKGTGSVLISGVPVVTGGGTATSLTINPGPLAVIGTTNLTGPLFIQPGTNGTLKGVNARIFHNATDAPTVGTTLETLYTFNLPANTLNTDGQSLRIHFYATTAANGNNKTILLTFGGTTIFTVGAGAFNNQMSSVVCDVFRTGAATQKAMCLSTQGTTNANASLAGQQFVTTPAEVLSGAVAILARATTPTAAGDVTARALMVDWYPQGQ